MKKIYKGMGLQGIPGIFNKNFGIETASHTMLKSKNDCVVL